MMFHNSKRTNLGSLHISPQLAIRTELQRKGYMLGSYDGVVNNLSCSDEVIGILRKRQVVDKKTLFGLLTITQTLDAEFIGTLGFCKDEFFAHVNPNGPWYLTVYGRDNVAELAPLIADLSKPYGAYVEVILGSEETRHERVPSRDPDPGF